jgi:adenylyltransferase/sulfurtransferase
VLLYLAAAGVGRIGVVDNDVVDLTNLQRQVVHGTPDIGRPKVDVAAESVNRINPHVQVSRYHTLLSKDNVLELIEPYDIVVDGCDNFPTRYLVNDACVMRGKKLVEAGILQFTGLLMTVLGQETACYRCVFPEPPAPGTVPSCQQAGVLGAVPGVLGSLQASEVLKLVTGVGSPLTNRLLQFDALAPAFYEVKVDRRADCPVCGKNPTITELVEYEDPRRRPAGGQCP